MVKNLPVDAPGLYQMTEADYHADVLPVPSLSRSIGQILIEQSPRHAWTAHPRLNPNWTPDNGRNARATDIGSAAHAMLLGQPVEIVEIDAETYQTKAAKEARQEAYDAGNVPLLRPDAELTRNMLARAVDELRRCQVSAIRSLADPAQAEGEVFNEIVAAWQDHLGGHWCRARIDRLAIEPKRITIIDYKTTEMSAAPDDVARAIFNNAYHLQDGFYRRGIRHLFPEIDRHERALDFLFIVQEQKPPHEITVARIDAAGRVIGEKMASAALRMWDQCMSSGEWPGYPGNVTEAVMPPYVETRWCAKEIEDPRFETLRFDPFPPYEARPYEPKPMIGAV